MMITSKRSEKRKQYSRQYYLDNIDHIKAYGKNLRANPDFKAKKKLSDAAYQKENKEKIIITQRIWAAKNKEKLRVYRLEYDKKNKDRLREVAIAYKLKNSEIIKKKNSEYIKRNRIQINAKISQRRKDNPKMNLVYLLRSRVRLSLKERGWSKDSKTQEMLGAPYDVVKRHIEKLFTKGMTWGNHGEWHIDHKIPIASAKTKPEIIKLFHYTNLQPLWAMDNLLKADSMPENHQMILTL